MKRNNVYDIAKCWAIVSVIIYHVINIIYNNQYVHSFIDTYFLTLFFFISGLLTKQEKVSQSGWIKKQSIHLMVPFVTIFIIYRVYQHFLYDVPVFYQKAFDDSKSGFWFIFSLYCFFLTLKLLLSIVGKTKWKLLDFILLIAPFFVVVALCLILSNEAAGYLSLMSYRRYWLFFILGYIISNYYNYERIFTNRTVLYLSLPVYIVLASLYIIKVQDVSSNTDFIIWFVANIAGCVFWVSLFEKLKQPLSKDAILNIGKNTLGIYLLHYFPLSWAKLVLGSEHLLCSNPLNYLYAIVTVIVILIVSYMMTWGVKQNKVLALCFLGINNKQ